MAVRLSGDGRATKRRDSDRAPADTSITGNPMTMNRILIALLVLASLGARAEDLPIVEPESVGFSAERLGKITEFTAQNVAEGRHVGIVTMVARHGQVVHFEAVGRYGLDNGRSLEKDSLFRIYSMTKPITTVAMMMLYEEGRFQLGDPVSKYLPEFADIMVYREGGAVPSAAPMTIEQLMTHTAGLTYGSVDEHPVEIAYAEAKLFESADLDEFVDRLAALPLRFEPGTRYHYSVATDVLGAIVERISGRTLDEFFRERIFEPLGMRDTFFNVPDDKLDRLASNHYWDAEADAIALMPPEYGRPPQGVTLFSGGGGLVSTAMDYMVFCEMLRRGGTYNGARLLGPKTIQYMTTNHLTDAVRNEGATEFPAYHLYPGQSFGLGFGVITDPGQSQVISSAGEYSWGGAADTKFWIDPEEDLVAILMTQLMRAPWETRYQMKVATYQALETLYTD
ncbi:MAG: beta-lactamase family protein [Gammaproteobacteria bacterium]|nr:beta-lactamase family protein [Gammaproteobacteria bacterium]MDH5312004.1 beta-lactamase family protein [Gammaproteobacteria bacterium]